MMKKLISLINKEYTALIFVLITFSMLNSCIENKKEKAKNQRSFNEEILKSYKDGLIDSLNTNQMLLTSNLNYTFELQNLIDSNNKILIPFDNIIDVAKNDSNYILKLSNNSLFYDFRNKSFTIFCNKNDFEKIWLLKTTFNKDSIDRSIFLLVNIKDGHKIQYHVAAESIDSESEYSSGGLEINYMNRNFELTGTLAKYFFIDQKK